MADTTNVDIPDSWTAVATATGGAAVVSYTPSGNLSVELCKKSSAPADTFRGHKYLKNITEAVELEAGDTLYHRTARTYNDSQAVVTVQ